MTDEIKGAADFALDADTRTLRGILLPWGEQSRLSVSGEEPVYFERGDVTLPADPDVVSLNRNHDRHLNVGRATVLEDRPEGVYAEFRVARTPEGDAYLDDYKRGMKALSAEVIGLARDAANTLRGVGARLTGAAGVPEGAFAGAALFSIAEPRQLEPAPGEERQQDPSDDDTADEIVLNGRRYQLVTDDEDTDETPSEAPAEETTEPEDPAEPEETSVTAATVPAAFRAAGDRQNTTTAEAEPMDTSALFAAIAKAKATGDVSELQQLDAGTARGAAMFALNDIKISGASQVGTGVVQAAWIGQLWSGRGFQRKVIPLLGNAPLTSLEVKGWRWGTRPEVNTWAGNKADVPSNTPTTTSYSVGIQRFAGGHDIAREFYDFNVTEVIQAYLAAMVESYAIKSDEYALSQLVAGATSAAVGTIPTGVGDGIAKITRGALRVLNSDATPSFALVAPDVFESLLFTKRDDVLAYLDMSLGLEEGTSQNFRIVPHTGLAAGSVLVGARQAATVLELPGSPIRVSAVDIARGGLDEALFGYIGVKVDYPTGLQLVTSNA